MITTDQASNPQPLKPKTDSILAPSTVKHSFGYPQTGIMALQFGYLAVHQGMEVLVIC